MKSSANDLGVGPLNPLTISDDATANFPQHGGNGTKDSGPICLRGPKSEALSMTCLASGGQQRVEHRWKQQEAVESHEQLQSSEGVGVVKVGGEATRVLTEGRAASTQG